MKIVQGDQIPLERGNEHRGGTFHFRRLLEGTPGTLGNFQLSMGVLGGDFFSPRHRHNFEQVRFQLEDTLSYGRDGKLEPGMVGYFPEGMAYGPQTQEPDARPTTLVLQCGGASGSGYLSRNEVKTGMEALSTAGRFEGGVYKRNPDVPGKRNTDAYQAIWEHVNGRPMTYPKARYDAPVFMDPKDFSWVPVEDVPGVAEKPLGVFTECRTEVGFYRLDPGASLDLEERSIYVVVSGAGEVAGEPARALTTIHLNEGESATLSATETLLLYHLGLPNLALLESRESATLQAAE